MIDVSQPPPPPIEWRKLLRKWKTGLAIVAALLLVIVVVRNITADGPFDYLIEPVAKECGVDKSDLTLGPTFDPYEDNMDHFPPMGVQGPVDRASGLRMNYGPLQQYQYLQDDSGTWYRSRYMVVDGNVGDAPNSIQCKTEPPPSKNE